MANLTKNTGYGSNFDSHLNEEHTLINLPDSSPCRDDATIISAAEDPEVPYSGASSKQSSHHVRIYRIAGKGFTSKTHSNLVNEDSRCKGSG